MGTIETVLFIFGVLLIVIIISLLVRIYYIIEQHGIQIAVLLKHEKEGFVPWRERAKVQNFSAHYRQNLLPENKQLKPHGQMLAINNQRAQRPCQILSTEQLNRYGGKGSIASVGTPEPKDGLAAHSEKAEELNITTEESLKTGNLSTMDVDTKTNYVVDEGAAVDQTGIVQDEVAQGQSEGFRVAMTSGNHRVVPSFLASMTEGFKQGNESYKARYRATHKGQHNW